MPAPDEIKLEWPFVLSRFEVDQPRLIGSAMNGVMAFERPPELRLHFVGGREGKDSISIAIPNVHVDWLMDMNLAEYDLVLKRKQ
jgi:hypothetical protein